VCVKKTYGDVVLLASAANLHGHGQKNQHVLNTHKASLIMSTEGGIRDGEKRERERESEKSEIKRKKVPSEIYLSLFSAIDRHY
jgi:hypothetical protein